MINRLCEGVRRGLEEFDPSAADVSMPGCLRAFSIGSERVFMVLLLCDDGEVIKYRILVSGFELKGRIASEEACDLAVGFVWRALFGACVRDDLARWCENYGFTLAHLRQSEQASAYAFGPGSSHFGVAMFYRADGSVDFCVRFNNQIVFGCERQRSSTVRRLVMAVLDRVAREEGLCAMVI